MRSSRIRTAQMILICSHNATPRLVRDGSAQRHFRRIRYLQAPAVGAANDSGLKADLHPSGTCRIAWTALGRPAELPHQVVRDLEGGIRIVRIDLGAGLVHAHDERRIALGDLVPDNLGYPFGGVALADDHQAPGH